jgi:hypothetical protein
MKHMAPHRSACNAAPSRGRYQRPGNAGFALALEVRAMEKRIG